VLLDPVDCLSGAVHERPVAPSRTVRLLSAFDQLLRRFRLDLNHRVVVLVGTVVEEQARQIGASYVLRSFP